MKEVEESKKYRKEKLISLIAQNKEVISNYELLFDKALLRSEIESIQNEKDEEKKKESESKYLKKLDEKLQALRKIEAVLDTIQRLESQLNDIDKENKTEGDTDTSKESVHPTKRHARHR